MTGLEIPEKFDNELKNCERSLKTHLEVVSRLLCALSRMYRVEHG